MKRIARKDFYPTKYSRLCSLHFKTDDFISHSIDQQTRRKQKRPNLLLTKKRLKSDAVPSIFKNIPEYYTFKDAPSRSGLPLSSSRLEKEAAVLDFQCESFLNDDRITSLDELYSKVSQDAQDKGFLLKKTDQHCNFILLSKEHPLFVQAAVTVSKDLEVNVYHLQIIVPQSLFSHILESRKVKLHSQITNLLAFAQIHWLSQKLSAGVYLPNSLKMILESSFYPA